MRRAGRISPRLSASYNLFGKGKTALKASGRYVAAESFFAVTNQMNPFAGLVSVQSRHSID